VKQGGFREVIMGTTPNVEGDGTALRSWPSGSPGCRWTITRLARGLTVGASLEQANRDMLADALSGRQKMRPFATKQVFSSRPAGSTAAFEDHRHADVVRPGNADGAKAGACACA